MQNVIASGWWGGGPPGAALCLKPKLLWSHCGRHQCGGRQVETMWGHISQNGARCKNWARAHAYRSAPPLQSSSQLKKSGDWAFCGEKRQKGGLKEEKEVETLEECSILASIIGLRREWSHFIIHFDKTSFQFQSVCWQLVVKKDFLDQWTSPKKSAR